MKIKQYDRQGAVAWSNSKAHSELLASAAFQEDQAGLYNLDILALDLQERNKNLNVIGNGYSDSPFRCVAWDNYGEKDAFSHGLIFTGMDNSSFKLWNPAQMVATYDSRPTPSADNLEWQEQEGCVIYEEELENPFPVMCGEWNSLNNHMLAFGTTDVFILLADQDPTNPDLRKPGKKNPHIGSYVTSVSWNREVGHILASASENGLVALWDVKSNSSIFHFGGDSAAASGSRNVVICWSKNISTQIAVTLDDEKSNKLQIWDLRNQKGPVVVIDKCHSKGINAMDWCETDPELILTASRDRKVVCWNYSQEEEPLSQASLDAQPISVKWSRKLPSIYSVSTETGTEVYSLSDANLFSYVPKWFKVPVASALSGNHLLTYAEQRGNVLQETSLPDHGKNSPLRLQLKAVARVAEHRLDEEEGQLAALIRAKGGEGDVDVYEYLGFSKSKIVQEAEKYTGKKREFATGHQKERNPKQKPKAYTQIQGQDALAFFANIKSQEQQQQAGRNEQEEGAETYDMVPRNFNWDLGKQRLVKQNILIGNYQGAIDAALKCGRTAEALIIAFSVDQALFSNTLKTFFTETTDSFITDVLRHIAYKDAEELVKKYDLKNWKECIALILTLAGKDKRPALLAILAHRLRTESPDLEDQLKQTPIPQNHPVVVCYVLAEKFEEITKLYFESLRGLESGSLQRKETVLEYARRLVMIHSNLTLDAGNTKLFEKIVREVAFIAIEERENALAHHLLSTYANSNAQKHLDYLVSNTPGLQTYKAAIKYKSIVLPLMQKKVEKKQPQQQQQKAEGKPQKPKAKIFDREEEVVKQPPTLPSKRREEPQEGGFSPYDNAKPVDQAPKKNLNTPPPPPVSHKKPVHVHEDEEPERDVPPPPPPKIQPVPVAKKPTPPPPPPPSHQPPAHHQDEDETAHRPIEKPPAKPITPIVHQKKTPPPPPPSHKQPPPPPPVQKQDSNTWAEQQTPKNRPPPPPVGRPNPPPPPPQRAYEPEVKEQPRKQPPPKLPPPKIEEKPKQSFQPPVRQEQAREQVYQPPQEPLKRTPPPPPGKRLPPPPPPRK